MLLQELAAASGVSVASIKFYRREGLLPPGERITATRQDYGQAHLDRLGLIAVLREEADASIPDIRALVTVLDDPSRPVVHALEIAQAIAAGLPAAMHADAVPDDEDPLVGELVRGLGWPDISSGPRAALDRQLSSMRAAGVPVTSATALRYGRVLGELAAGDLEAMRRPVDEEANPCRPEEPSRDVVVRRAVLGMVAYERLAQVVRALALASLSVAAEDDAAEQNTTERQATQHDATQH